VYKENGRGPSTEPCGTPVPRVSGSGQGAIPCDLIGAISQIGSEPG